MDSAERETIRILGPGDESVLRAFLAQHPDTTLFLQSNLMNAGLVDNGERCQGTYAAAFQGEQIVGVVSHVWNGMVLVACADALAGLPGMLKAAVAGSGRRVGGFTGADPDVRAAVRLCELTDAATSLDGCERLYRLILSDLILPEALANGAVRGRRGRAADLPQLQVWGEAYQREAIDATPGAALQAEVEAGMRANLEAGVLWVAEREGSLVSMTRFNASTEDAVQVGGVYTPPALRSRGYAACAVAASLRDAAAEGASRSILFTAKENVPAQRCYEGLGYEAIGGYGLVVLREPQHVASALGADATAG